MKGKKSGLPRWVYDALGLDAGAHYCGALAKHIQNKILWMMSGSEE